MKYQPIRERVRNLCIVGLGLIVMGLGLLSLSYFLSFLIIWAGLVIIGGTVPGGYGRKIGGIGGGILGWIIGMMLSLLVTLLVEGQTDTFEVTCLGFLNFGIPSSLVGYLVGGWADEKKKGLEIETEMSKKTFISSQQMPPTQKELQYSSKSEDHFYQDSRRSYNGIEKDIEKSERPIERERRSQEKIECPSCGKEISSNSHFCTYCGKEVAEDDFDIEMN